MKQIILDSVCIEGFRSYTEPTVISFTDTSGLKFVSGDNQVEPSLESNGAGKSTVFDAIVWCLYGTSVKGLRASDLMSRGAKRMQVMVILAIDGNTVAVQRTSPPNRVTVDGHIVEQYEIDRLVGLSRDRCLNSVVFGQSVPLFIDRSLPERGDLLDDVLGLGLWLDAADKATQRYRTQERELSQLMLQVERLNGQLLGLPDVNELQEQEEEWEADRDIRLRDLWERLQTAGAEAKKMKKLPPAGDDDALYGALVASRTALSDKERQCAVWQNEHHRLGRDSEWLRDHDTCPTCHQTIDEKFRRETLARYKESATAFHKRIMEIAAAMTSNKAEIDTLEEQQRSFNNIKQQRAVLEAQADAKQREVDDLHRQVVRTRDETNPYTAQRQRVDQEQRRLSAELDEKQVDAAVLTKYLAQLDFWKQGFRRVRLFCLDTVLRELTLETRNSLTALGLADWQVNYTTATETKSGTMKLGVQMTVVPPGEQTGNFNVLSGGEGQRVRLAASLGLSSLIQRWAGVRWNFEIWDEPTAWLSTRGVENLLDALIYRAQIHSKSILLADHRSLAHSGFAESYRVTKDAQGSHWRQV